MESVIECVERNNEVQEGHDIALETRAKDFDFFPKKSLLELSKSSWLCFNGIYDKQTYLRGCKWSPDGTCCLAVVNNDGMHVCELPRDLYEGIVAQSRNVDIIDSVIHVKECGLIYDFCWFPGMNSQIPESCCWLTTRQNGPIQLWDAFDGTLRCTYRGYNSVDELEPAISLSFAADGSHIHAGYKKCIRTFDITRPGRTYAECKINSPAACLVSSPYHQNLMAVGSWKTEISLYNVKEDFGLKSVGKMHGHSGGITNVIFHPDGTKLISGARKDPKLIIWDLRDYRRPFRILERKVDTNQRIYFDLSPCGKFLVSGNTSGVLSAWNLNEEIDEIDFTKYMFPLHNDCCNGVSMHPLRPIVATASGQHHNLDPFISSDSEVDADGSELFDNDILESDPVHSVIKCKPIENSLTFWWIGKWSTE